MALPVGLALGEVQKAPLAELPEPFQVPFGVPPVLKAARRERKADYYRVTMREAEAEIIPGLRTPIWGYNGQFPGPTIRARKGRRSVVRFQNRLPEAMVVHNHGAYADGNNDGHPSDTIRPERAKEYDYNNRQNARTMWYHDHVEHLTAPHVYKGLAGFYLISDDFERDLPLPKGPYDLPVMIQDRLFNEDGSFSEDTTTPGNVMLVNGRPQPRLEVGARKYRLRLLNASNIQTVRLALVDAAAPQTNIPFTVIGTEGGLMEAPVTVAELPVAAAERYEVVVDFSAHPVGTRLVMKNLASLRPSTEDVMCFDVVRQETDGSSVPEVLRPAESQLDPTHQPADPDSAVRTKTWTLDQADGNWTINGMIWDEDRIDAAPREGETEIWEFVNATGVEHPAHVHLTNFKVLDRNGAPPQPYENGWKETVTVGGFQTVRVLIKWPRVPVERGSRSPYIRRYPFHCHQLQHEDHMMMAQFRVGKAL